MAPIFGIYRSFEGSVDTFVQTGMGRFPNSVFIAQLLTGAIKIDLGSVDVAKSRILSF